MQTPETLMTLHPDVEVPAGLDLLVTLTGHMDAGRLGRQLRETVRERLECVAVAEADLDAVYDYRARRPRVRFDRDRYTDLRMPRLGVDLVQDLLGHPFLMLSGPEPDLRWHGFAAEVLRLAERWQVNSLVLVDSVPMPVPHTRRVGVTAHGTRTDVLEGLTTWSAEAEIMAGLLQVLEVAAEDRGLPTAGYSLHVPHYIAEAKFPQAAVAAFEYAGAAMGLMLPTDELRDKVREVEAELDRQTSGSEEIQAMVAGLERTFDQNVADQERSLLETSEGLPDGDELASAVEAYLLGRQAHDDGAGGPATGPTFSDPSPDTGSAGSAEDGPSSPAQDDEGTDGSTDSP
ncbi:PAC2 family protein [Micrococcus luteus]